MSKEGAEDTLYFDASALIALLAPGDVHHSSATRILRTRQPHMVTSSVSEVEIGRGLGRRGAPASVQRAARELLGRCQVVELTPEVRQRAVDVRPGSVRSLDAIHIATALVAGLKGFVSYDERQRLSAEEMGLKPVGRS